MKWSPMMSSLICVPSETEYCNITHKKNRNTKLIPIELLLCIQWMDKLKDIHVHTSSGSRTVNSKS